MDISRQAYSEANSTGVSMYLSFDSSISSAAYKTLEATTNELSMLSNMDHEEETVENSQELNQNSTLEALDPHLNYIESIKEIDTHSQLSAVPKRILQEFNVVSSTPTKEQILRSVEVIRGSSVERCVDLRLGFMDFGEKKGNHIATDKENALPLNEVTVLSDNKTEVGSGTKESKDEQVAALVDEDTMKEKGSQMANTHGDKIPKATIEPKVTSELESKVPISVVNKRFSMVRKPICEPDLLTNRPSRIATNANKRFSVNNIASKTNIEKEICTEIPKLMNKVLKFSEATTVVNDRTKNSAVLDKRKSILSNPKGRYSMLPTNSKLHAEKRPFAFTQRMSVLVKTTLNSPARKIARRSVLPTAQQSWKSAATNVPIKPSRKSILPVGKIVHPCPTAKNAQITTKPVTESLKPLSTKRKSMFPNDKPLSETNKTTNAPTLHALNTKVRPATAVKTDTSFVCNVCGSKFSIKSLLDAHKRSHEGDELPAFVKKPTASVSSVTSAVSQTNGVNKCKYCDKKFALLRALHIHLLQNCSKIPPNEKRKLKFHEMDHVEKAQLPPVFHASSANGKINSQVPVTSSTSAPPHRSHSDLSSISVSSVDSASDKKALAEITMIANHAAAVANGLLPEMAPPTARMVKKTTAHAGVHRTPNKAIICHICKISFKCIMDHLQHSMTVHFKQVENRSSSGSSDKKTPTNDNANANVNK